MLLLSNFLLCHFRKKGKRNCPSPCYFLHYCDRNIPTSATAIVLALTLHSLSPLIKNQCRKPIKKNEAKGLRAKIYGLGSAIEKSPILLSQ